MIAAVVVLALVAGACSDDGPDPDPVKSLNELLAVQVPTWSTWTSAVRLVDHWTWFDPAVHSKDGIHPSPAGEAEMAARWVRGVRRELQPSPGTVVRVMPLGDSITDDFTRYDTWQGLVEAGYQVDFVGTQSSIPASRAGDVPDVAGLSFDQDHEGHSGWAASEILAGNPDEPDAGRLVEWLKTVETDVVLLHVGTNDLARLGSDAELVADRISRIVFELQQVMPDVTIFVAQITPIGFEK